MDDLLDQMRGNPAAGWRMSDVERLCTARGARCEPPRGGGSHYKISMTGATGNTDDPFQATDQTRIYSQARCVLDFRCLVAERLPYAILIEPLSVEDGGGFLATVPELPGCMSDGETEFEAIRNVQDAIDCWIEAATENERPIPSPAYRRPIAV